MPKKLEYLCKICEKNYSSRQSIWLHNQKFHNQNNKLEVSKNLVEDNLLEVTKNLVDDKQLEVTKNLLKDKQLELSKNLVEDKQLELNNKTNNLFNDDKLIQLIKENFNDDDNQLFKLSFNMYVNSQNNIDDFIVNFDDIYKWIGFTKKSDAKKLLVKSFINNLHYKMTLRRSPQRYDADEKHPKKGGENKETIMLTINCFKKFCMKASTKEADKIYDYYIKMEIFKKILIFF